MPSTRPGTHLCPTRVDDHPALVAHRITEAMCQARQREHYHKCPTCVHRNELNGTPRPGAVPPAPRAVVESVAAR